MKRKRFNLYVDIILKEFGVSRETLFTKNKEREIVDARQMLYWACYVSGFTIAIIIRMMEENDYYIQYPSVRQGIDRMSKNKDKDYAKLKERICSN